jgi:hypothetical protein
VGQVLLAASKGAAHVSSCADSKPPVKRSNTKASVKVPQLGPSPKASFKKTAGRHESLDVSVDVGGPMQLWTGESGFDSGPGSAPELVFDDGVEIRTEKAMCPLCGKGEESGISSALAIWRHCRRGRDKGDEGHQSDRDGPVKLTVDC